MFYSLFIFGCGFVTSVSLGKRSYSCIHETETVSSVRAQSSKLVIHLPGIFVVYVVFLIPLFLLPSILVAGILSFLCGEEVVMQQCSLKVRSLINSFFHILCSDFILLRGLYGKLDLFVARKVSFLCLINLVGGLVYIKRHKQIKF